MDEKKKRGRPKKIETTSVDNDDINKIKKKRGRKKKIDAIHQLPLALANNSKEESNYIVMLDIRYSDLDNTVATLETFKTKSDKLFCEDLIESFSQLIRHRRNMYDSDSACSLKPIHDRVFSPEHSNLDFYSTYDHKETNLTVLPIFHINGEEWPSNSPYSCWNCDCQFDSVPIGIPECMVNDHFQCYGNFCSFACAGRYIVDNDHTVNRFEKLSLLNRMYQMMYKLDITDYVKIAGPKQVLHKYGGCLSYSQYHDSDVSQKVEIYKLPIIPLHLYICNESSTNQESVEETAKEVITITGS